MGGEVLAKCRSVLDIVDNTQFNVNENYKNVMPDALSIMMNPGASKPKDPKYIFEEIELTLANELREKIVIPTVPDDTQKRLMKIMRMKNWKYLKVINLSDICQHDSKKLSGHVRQYNQKSAFSEHSIFSDLRQSELNEIISQMKGKPVIRAWGTQKCLAPYIKRCNEEIADLKLYGIKAKNEGYYHHPLTTRTSWINQMIELLKE